MDEPKQPDGFGLRRSERLEAKRKAQKEKAAAEQPQTLNPPFPFEVVPFDPRFFGL
jgi:hypothetical protein